MFIRQVKVQLGKSTVQNFNIKDKNADYGGKQTTFQSISSLIGRAFSIFRQKMDGPNPSKTDIKVYTPTPAFLFTVLKNIFPKWETEKFFLSWENELKIKKYSNRNSKYKKEINTLKDKIQLLTNRLDSISVS